MTPLMRAVAANNAEAVKVLLEYGSDVHQKSFPPSPKSAISWLAAGSKMNLAYHIYPYQSSKSKKDVLELLIKYGADINEMYDGQTPLSVAISTADEDAVSFLLAKGARLSSPFAPGKEFFAIESEMNTLKDVNEFLRKNGDSEKYIERISKSIIKEYQKR